MKKILYYRSDETIYMCLYNFCISHNIVLQRVDDSLLNIKLKDVFALQEEHNGKCEAFPDSYLLLDEISNEELVNLLRNLKENGCPFEGIKVTRTANNHIWSLEEVLKETGLEHRVMQKAGLLEMMMKTAASADFAHMDKETAGQIKAAVMDAFIYLQNGSFTEAELDQKCRALKEMLRQAAVG